MLPSIKRNVYYTIFYPDLCNPLKIVYTLTVAATKSLLENAVATWCSFFIPTLY